MSSIVRDRLPSISLDEINALAELHTRVDRKYVIDHATFDELLDAHTDALVALEIDGRRTFAYSTQYFDTTEHAIYLAAAYSRRGRYKIRTRIYEGSDVAMLEVKTKDGRGKTVKTRMEYPLADVERLTDEAVAFVEASTGRPGTAADMKPMLNTRFDRMTVADVSDRSRATFDRHLLSTDHLGRTVGLDAVIVESKSNGTPAPIDHWLWQLGVRPIRMSKFSTSTAALNPQLPHNKWHRTLTRHFA